MAKPKRDRYAGVGVFVDGTLLSRVQSFKGGSDLGTQNLNELTNTNIVEIKSGLPTVSITIDTNECGTINNIYALAGRKVLGIESALQHAIIDHNSFDGTSVDICVQVEEDNVLKRTAYIGDSFVSSIAWSFDVGGIATENISLEADNKTWYLNSRQEVYSMYAHRLDYNAVLLSGVTIAQLTAVGVIPSGIRISQNNQDFITDPYNMRWANHPTAGTGVIVSGASPAWGTVASPIDATARYRVTWYHPGATSGGTLRTNIPTTGFGSFYKGLSTSTIGGVNKGMIQIYLISGGNMYSNPSGTGSTGSLDDEVLRAQSCSISADLGRVALEELGNFKAYDRSLKFPVPITVTFSANASDLEEWAALANQKWYNGTGGTFKNSALYTTNITQFINTAALIVFIYDDTEGAVSRNLLKKIVVTKLKVSNESFGVDQGNNATQDFTCISDNFMVSGAFYG